MHLFPCTIREEPGVVPRATLLGVGGDNHFTCTQYGSNSPPSIRSQVGSCLVFNVCGNNYRLICGVTYANAWARGTLYVKHFLTHADYDKGKWKADCGR